MIPYIILDAKENGDMIYMLFDNPADEKDMVFLQEYETQTIQQIYPKNKCKTIKDMLIVCNDTLQKSKSGDTIICWYDFMGILCWWLSKIRFKNRKIIILNILLKYKNTVKNQMARFLYKLALDSDRVQATVTSYHYGVYLNNILHSKIKYTVLHDIFHDRYCIDYKGEIDKKTVFCGGKNGRDWELLCAIAKEMPDVKFNCVMHNAIYKKLEGGFTKNMRIKVDICEEEFLKLLCKSQIVVIPLDTESPAGLIVIYQSIANGKMVITSNTVTTREYFCEERGVLCNNIAEWKRSIYYYLSHTDEALIIAQKCRAYLENECSEKKYAKILFDIIDTE